MQQLRAERLATELHAVRGALALVLRRAVVEADPAARDPIAPPLSSPGASRPPPPPPGLSVAAPAEDRVSGGDADTVMVQDGFEAGDLLVTSALSLPLAGTPLQIIGAAQ